MDGHRFDTWTRALTVGSSPRRTVLRALAAGALGGLAGGARSTREAAAGDRQTGRPCTRNAQCITEICRGRRRRKRCRCIDGLGPCGPRGSNNCCVDPLVCRDGQCVNHCASGRKDRNETDVDCGGDRCSPCGPFKRCIFDTDCESGHCDENFRCSECSRDEHCTTPPFDVCVDRQCKQCRLSSECPSGRLCVSNLCIPHCNNNQFDPPGETDVDCGGACARKCRIGQRCVRDSDCASNFCHPTERFCSTPRQCANGVQDDEESDVDCGGPTCPKCDIGQQCLENRDCQSGFCLDCCVECGDGSQCRASSACP